MQHLPVDQAQNVEYVLERNFRVAIRDELIQDAFRVTHAAVCRARDRVQRFIAAGDVFRIANLAQQSGEIVESDSAKIEALAARDDRRGDLVRLGGRQDEYRVRRGFLKSLEQRVEGRDRELMHLIDHIHLVTRSGRHQAHVLANLPHVLDAVIRGAVNLDHIDIGTGGDRGAVRARSAGLRRGHVDRGAVEALGENARGGRLADPAGSDEQKGVADSSGADGVLERPGDVLLTDDVFEGLWPPSPGEH